MNIKFKLITVSADVEYINIVPVKSLLFIGAAPLSNILFTDTIPAN